jgi:hypothetical protein
MCVSRLLKHTVDPTSPNKVSCPETHDGIHGFLPGRNRPANPSGNANGFEERGKNVGAER